MRTFLGTLGGNAAAALLLPLVLIGPATALTPAEIAQQSAGSVVKLEAFTKRDGNSTLLGEATGFIVDRNGYILTVRHLFGERPSSDVRNSKKIEVRGRIRSQLSQSLPLEVVDVPEGLDFVLLRLPDLGGDYPGLAIRAVPGVNGDSLLGMGFPAGFDLTLAPGVLANRGGPNGRWQVTMPLNPGMSGGPVFDTEGCVVGVISAGVQALQQVNFVDPINHAASLLARTFAGRVALPTETIAQTPIERSYEIDKVKDDHPELLQPHGRDYDEVFEADAGYRFSDARLQVHSETRASDAWARISSDGKKMNFHVRLTSGPLVDQYRGWYRATLITTQVPDGPPQDISGMQVTAGCAPPSLGRN